MQEVRFEEKLEQILVADSRYHRDAYMFLREALDVTQKQFAKEEREAARQSTQPQEEKHVTGQQLLLGIQQCALEQFGPMTITVLEEWGIRACQDFGNIVFNMVEFELLRKTDTDSRKDFEGGYDFEEAFRHPFLPSSKIPRKTIEPTL
jgi:uncharacterized repeat protein (TIGR04138 family)